MELKDSSYCSSPAFFIQINTVLSYIISSAFDDITLTFSQNACPAIWWALVGRKYVRFLLGLTFFDKVFSKVAWELFRTRGVNYKLKLSVTFLKFIIQLKIFNMFKIREICITTNKQAKIKVKPKSIIWKIKIKKNQNI